jgi:hypothetical protein
MLVENTGFKDLDEQFDLGVLGRHELASNEMGQFF